MPSVLPFDELNLLHEKKGKKRSIPIKKWFSEMRLPEQEIKDREEFAEEMKDDVFRILALLFTILEMNRLEDIYFVKKQLSDSIIALFNNYTYPDSETLGYIEKYSSDFIDTTVSRTKLLFGIDVSDEKLLIPVAYWLSEDRATYNAENEANTLFNKEQFRQVKADGLLHKQWQTMKDERVRLTHVEVDNTILPIDVPFTVGDSLMMYPRDRSLGASADEIINCRCTCRYF